MKHTLKKLDKSQIEIDFELEADEFLIYTEKALVHLKKHLKMDGFRPGNVPTEVAEKQIGDENLLMEAGDLAVKESYQKFVKENDIEPVGNTQVQIIKIAKGSPFQFKVTVSVMPEITLPDYKAIAGTVKNKEISVEPQEVEDAIKYLQKSRAKIAQKDKEAANKDFVAIEYSTEGINNGKVIKDQFILGEGGFMKDFEASIVGMKAEEEKDITSTFPENHPDKSLAGKEAVFKVKMVSVSSVEMPEINDDFAKTMGAFDTMVMLKESIKEGIDVEKKEEAKHQKRGEILEKIAMKTDVQVPLVMVEYEEKRLFENFKTQVTQSTKISFEEYLSSIKKPEEEIKKTFHIEAEKRLRDYLVLREIGKKENVEITAKEIDEEAQKVMKSYPKEQSSQIDINQIKEYAKDTIFNEKVFKLLENFSK